MNKALEELIAVYDQHNNLTDVNDKIAKAQVTLNGLHAETQNEMKRLVDLQRRRAQAEKETKEVEEKLDKLKPEHSNLAAEVARLRAIVQQIPDFGPVVANLKRTG